MRCMKQFKNTLNYISPAHGGWGQVRMCLLVPESHMLFVCPFACGRHGGLGAVLNGQKDRVSYLYIKESDIIEGYDEKIIEACDCLLEELDYRPKAVITFVTCLDDLIGTDHDAILEELNLKYDDVRFQVCHMNPIQLGGKNPPTPSNYRQMLDFLEPSEKKENTVNVIGNFVRIGEASELYRVLKHAGISEVNQLCSLKEYEEFEEMAKAKYNIVVSPIAKKAAKHLEKKLGIPSVTALVSYDFLKIKLAYDNIYETLDIAENKQYDFEDDIQTAKDAIESTLSVIGDTPVVIDSSAVKKPFELANTLLCYGFNVQMVFANEFVDDDKRYYKKIKEEYSHINVINNVHPENLVADHRLDTSIAIGFEAAHLCGSKCVLNFFNDETMYGYYGITHLMELIQEAYSQEIKLKNILDDYGLVV